MKKIVLGIVTPLLLGVQGLPAQELPDFERIQCRMTPLELGRFVADRIVDNTAFGNELVMQRPYADVEYLDFGGSLDARRPSVAYALTTFRSEADQRETFGIGRTGSVKIWINDRLVYDARGDRDLPVRFSEKYYELPEKFEADIKKGDNKVLVKTAYGGEGPWELLMQSVNLGVYAGKGLRIRPTLQCYAPQVEAVNWLILGCFDDSDGRAMDRALGPENDLGLFRVHESGGRTFTWNIPRVNLNIAQTNGGKFYAWAYHVGCFMWSLQCLSQATGEPKYNDFAARWGDYTLSLLPVVEHQTRTLHAVRSMNWGMSFRPMLDYTTAPSMPFMTRIVYEKEFENRAQWKRWADTIMNYLVDDQFRLPDGLLAREYTGTPSVWADDMFMGVPYLLFSADHTDDPQFRSRLHDDAANQIVLFNRMLFRPGPNLYMQASYVGRDDKIPFWSRGNGWALWATSEVLLHLPKKHKQYKTILDIFRRHVDGIARAQDPDGYWRNILDMRETVRESSGNAIFVMVLARGVNEGWLDRKTYGPVIEKGWDALRSFIDTEGNLHGVKGGTNFSTDPEDYARTRFVKSDTHGMLPLIFACIEMERYLNGQK